MEVSDCCSGFFVGAFKGVISVLVIGVVVATFLVIRLKTWHSPRLATNEKKKVANGLFIVSALILYASLVVLSGSVAYNHATESSSWLELFPSRVRISLLVLLAVVCFNAAELYDIAEEAIKNRFEPRPLVLTRQQKFNQRRLSV